MGESSLLSDMEHEAERQMVSFSGACSFFFHDIGSGREIQYEGDRIFPSASLIKLPLVLAAARMASGQDGNQKVPLSPRNRAGGTGGVYLLNDSYIPTLHELMFLAIAWSDNTAANQLIDWIGGFGPVRDLLHEKHMDHTRMEKKMLDGAAAAAGAVNETTACDMGRLLTDTAERIDSHNPADQPERFLFQAMKRQQYRNKLPALIPAEESYFPPDKPGPGHVLVGNKTGDLGRVQHDGGIFVLPSGRIYVLAVCTVHETWGQAGCRLIAELSRTVWQHMSRLPDLPADH